MQHENVEGGCAQVMLLAALTVSSFFVCLRPNVTSAFMTSSMYDNDNMALRIDSDASRNSSLDITLFTLSALVTNTTSHSKCRIITLYEACWMIP